MQVGWGRPVHFVMSGVGLTRWGISKPGELEWQLEILSSGLGLATQPPWDLGAGHWTFLGLFFLG